MCKRFTYITVCVGNSVALADYLTLTFVKFLSDKPVQLLGIYFQFNVVLNIHAAAENIRNCERVALAVALDRLIDVYLGKLMLDFAKVHFNLIIYYTLTETANNSLYVGSVRIISAKKPSYSLLCSEDTDELTIEERLRVMRLRAGLTIEQAAQAVGVERRRVMNYELGKIKHMKKDTLAKLFKLYEKK